MNDIRIDLLIDNRAVSSGEYAEVRDPGRTSDVVGRVAQADAGHVDAAVRAAARAFPSWHETSVADRSVRLVETAALLEAIADELTPIVVAETGMLPTEIRTEILGAAFAVRDNIEAAQGFLEPVRFEDEQSWVSVEKRAIGVIAAFVPWNAPIVLMMRKLAPALLCGNTMVIKTPPTTPLGLGLLLSRVSALFPPGVINVVHGGNAVGAALSAHPQVRAVSFTGGGRAATAIMKAAADTIKRIQFELGGNDPAIVLDDADLDVVVPTLVAGTFHRSGQFCFAIKRIYVPQALSDAFFGKMREVVGKFRIGHPLDVATTFGPVNNAQQYENVKGLIARARAAGSEVVELGTPVDPSQWDRGYYIRPTLIRPARIDDEIVTCEQFGPVVPIITYRDEAEVIRLANDTEYGLGSSIWSSNPERALSVSRQIEAGMTFINKNAQSRLGRRHMPFGGVKQSGIGTENSELGLVEYIEYHAINFHKTPAA